MNKWKFFLFTKVSYDSVYFQSYLTLHFFLKKSRCNSCSTIWNNSVSTQLLVCRFWNLYFFFFSTLWINDADNNINNDVISLLESSCNDYLKIKKLYRTCEKKLSRTGNQLKDFAILSGTCKDFFLNTFIITSQF